MYKFKPNVVYVDGLGKYLNAKRELLRIGERQREHEDYSSPKLGCDTETTGLDPFLDKVILLQLGTKYKQYVFDVFRVGEKRITELLVELNAEDYTFIFHNAKFDLKMLRTNFGVTLNKYICTWVMATLLHKGNKSMGNGLAACLDKYLGIKMDKEQQTTFIGMKLGDTFTQEQINYAALDVAHMDDLNNKLESYLNKRGMGQLSNMENFTVAAMVELELSGVYLDREMWLAVEKKAKGRLDAAREALNGLVVKHSKIVQTDLFNEPMINYGSPKQLQPVLEEILEVPLTGTGEPELAKVNSTIKAERVKLEKALSEKEDEAKSKRLKQVKTKLEFIETLLNFREASKKVSTYGRSFLEKYVHPKTGRIHSDFKQLGADTGRMASANPNMQNIPAGKEYRECFRVNDPKYKMVSADFSGWYA